MGRRSSWCILTGLLLLVLFATPTFADSDKVDEDALSPEAQEVIKEQVQAKVEKTQNICISLMLLGSVGFMMANFYLVNWPDEDIKRISWEVISSTVSIFSAVLLFQACDKVLEYYVLEGLNIWLQLGIDMVHMLLWFAGLQIVLAYMTGALGEHDEVMAHKKSLTSIDHTPSAELPRRTISAKNHKKAIVLNTKCWAILLGHITGFAAINAWGTLQQALPHSLPFSSLVPVITVFGIYGIYAATDYCRDKVTMTDGEEDEWERQWDKEVQETEDDVMCLAVSFLSVQVLRFAISGVLPNAEGEDPDWLTHSTSACVLLLVAGFVCGGSETAKVVICQLLWRHKTAPAEHAAVHAEEHGRFGEEEGEEEEESRAVVWARDITAMSTAWCLHFSVQWWFSSNFHAEGAVLAILICLVVTGLALALIFVLDLLADMDFTDDEVDRSLRALIHSLGILIGFSWERSFDAAVGGLSEGQEFGLPPPLITLALAIILSSMVVPAWKWYILPHVIENQEDYELARCRSKSGSLEDLSPCLKLPLLHHQTLPLGITVDVSLAELEEKYTKVNEDHKSMISELKALVEPNQDCTVSELMNRLATAMQESRSRINELEYSLANNDAEACRRQIAELESRLAEAYKPALDEVESTLEHIEARERRSSEEDQRRVAELVTELERANARTEEAQRLAAEAQAASGVTEADLQAHSNRIAELEETLRTETAGHEEITENCHRVLEAQRRRIEEMEAIFISHEAEADSKKIRELQTVVSEMEKSKEDLQQRMKSLEETNRKTNAELEALTRSSATLAEKAQKMRRAEGDYVNTIEQLKAEVDQGKEELKQSDEALKKLKRSGAERETLRQELGNAQTKLEKATEELQSRRVAFEKELEEARTRIFQLEDEATTWEQKVNAEARRVSMLEIELEQQEVQIAAKGDAHSRATHMQAMVADQADRQQEFLKDAAAREEHIRQLEAEIEKLQQEMELRPVRVDLAQINAMQVEAAALRDKLAHSSKKVDECMDRMVKLEKENARLRDEVTRNRAEALLASHTSDRPPMQAKPDDPRRSFGSSVGGRATEESPGRTLSPRRTLSPNGLDEGGLGPRLGAFQGPPLSLQPAPFVRPELAHASPAQQLRQPRASSLDAPPLPSPGSDQPFRRSIPSRTSFGSSLSPRMESLSHQRERLRQQQQMQPQWNQQQVQQVQTQHQQTQQDSQQQQEHEQQQEVGEQLLQSLQYQFRQQSVPLPHQQQQQQPPPQQIFPRQASSTQSLGLQTTRSQPPLPTSSSASLSWNPSAAPLSTNRPFKPPMLPSTPDFEKRRSPMMSDGRQILTMPLTMPPVRRHIAPT